MRERKIAIGLDTAPQPHDRLGIFAELRLGYPDEQHPSAQLNDTATASHIWAEHYDRDLIDVFAVQGEITDAIVTAIEPQIYVAEIFAADASRPTPWTPGIW
jgi:hypothetical protein